MKPPPDDPKWTAYLLDELDAETRRACEAELAADPDLRDRVDALSQTLDLLREAFQQPVPGSEGVTTACARVIAPPARAPIRLWLPTALAAMLAVGFGLSRFLTRPGPERLQFEASSFPEDGRDLDMESEEAAPMELGLQSWAHEAAEDAAVPSSVEPLRRMRAFSLEEAPADGGAVGGTFAAPAPPPAPVTEPRPEGLMRREATGFRAMSSALDDLSQSEVETLPAVTPIPTPTPTPTPTPIPEPEEDESEEEEEEEPETP